MKYAWIDPENVVRDICPGLPEELYHPDVAKLYAEEVPDDIVVGASRPAPKGKWKNPEAPEPAAPAVPQLAPIPPADFYLAFTMAERVSIKKSKDEGVKEFWQTFEMLLAKDIAINPNLASVQEGLMYLATAGACIDKARIPDILAGKAQ